MEREPGRKTHTRWTLIAVALFGLLAVMAACKSVTDGVLSSRSGATETANCISACAHSANESIRVESDLHVANVHACAGDSTCLANEAARHQAAVRAIQDQRKACQDGCRHQGGGGGR